MTKDDIIEAVKGLSASDALEVSNVCGKIISNATYAKNADLVKDLINDGWKLEESKDKGIHKCIYHKNIDSIRYETTVSGGRISLINKCIHSFEKPSYSQINPASFIDYKSIIDFINRIAKMIGTTPLIREMCFTVRQGTKAIGAVLGSEVLLDEHGVVMSISCSYHASYPGRLAFFHIVDGLFTEVYDISDQSAIPALVLSSYRFRYTIMEKSVMISGIGLSSTNKEYTVPIRDGLFVEMIEIVAAGKSKS